MKALILAAGYAVRLYPLTKKYPKPLLPVAGRPIINYIVDKLQAIDQIDEIIVVTNSKFIVAFRRWADKLRCKKRISLINDLTRDNSDRLGAIGDMNLAILKKRIKDDLLVIGGDNLFDQDLSAFLSFTRHKKNQPVIGVYDIKDITQANRYGVVRLDRENRIIDFKEKPSKPESKLVAMCLYYFPKGKLKYISEYMRIHKEKKDATGFYIDWLRKKIAVYGFVVDCIWYDIGDHSFYRKAQKRFGSALVE